MKSSFFLCPCCGNELGRTDKPVIICTWCRSKIVPQGKRIFREPELISIRKKKGEEEKNEED